MVIILYFMFSVYATSPIVGSPSVMYDLLQKAAIKRPVDGNKGGSYVTMKSNYALVFGIIQLCSGSGTVFLDQAYWQRAIASRPTTAVRAYILGGLAWFAIPFGFATTLGLAAIALTDNPAFPTYPKPMTESQITAGLASSFAASTLLGQGGAVALLIVLFMAVTSCASAELIAVSSVLTFDIYKTYIKPAATPSQLIFISHVMICVFGLTMAIFACIWNAIGIDLGWLFLVMGLLIGGAVFPTAFAITWKGQTRAGAISGAVVGLMAGLIAWLVTAKQCYGALTVATTGKEYPTLAGNLAAIMIGLIVSVTVSFIKPDHFDWEITRSINQSTISTSLSNDNDSHARDSPIVVDAGKENHQIAETMDEPRKLRGAFKVACIASFLLTFIMDFLIPIPMFLSHYTFSKGFFVAWVIISFIWVFCSAAISVILPLYEALGFFRDTARDIGTDLRKKKDVSDI
jgi:urea-proton symporter